MKFTPSIGFEVHAQLATETKMFCRCRNETGAEPNTLVCPVCLGLPGSLPVPNAEAFEMGLRVAAALGSSIPEVSGFDRKSYFYPDLPKGYQITQARLPVGRGGRLDFETDGGKRSVRLRQVHVEEDAGKTVHEEGAGLVDMNRCGVPLVEIVTEPDIESVEDADAFLEELRRVLVYLGVTSGEMHEGSLRFDTNVSVRGSGDEQLGTATEIKNLNSFRSVREALAHEIDRQTGLLAAGRGVEHETMLWDPGSGRALPMRSKEVASDYRYFPEPDIPDIAVSREWAGRVRAGLPELPAATRARFASAYRLRAYDVRVLTAEPATASYFELTLRELVRLLHPEAGLVERSPRDGWSAAGVAGERGFPSLGAATIDTARPVEGIESLAKTVSNWVMVTVGGRVNAEGSSIAALAATVAAPERLARIIAPRVRGELSEPAAKRLFTAALTSGEPVSDLIDRLGLALAVREDVVAAVTDALERNPREAERLASGEEKLLRFFVGVVMKETGGSADPATVERLLRERVGAEGPPDGSDGA